VPPATDPAVDLNVTDVLDVLAMSLDSISATSVQLVVLAAVLTQTGQLLATLSLVVVLDQLPTVLILPWAITQVHLTIVD
jgi:hypothetical protein